MAVRADNSRVVVLCKRLAEATRAGNAEWRRDEEDIFVWQGKPATVSIASRDKDGQPPYQLAVVNPEGEKLEELASQLVDNDRPAEWNEPLADLYRAARRSALHVDDVIQALIDALPVSDRAPETPSSV